MLAVRRLDTIAASLASSRGGSGANSNCGIGAMEPGLAGGEFVETIFVFGSEVHAQFWEGFVGSGAGAPHIACRGEYAS